MISPVSGSSFPIHFLLFLACCFSLTQNPSDSYTYVTPFFLFFSLTIDIMTPPFYPWYNYTKVSVVCQALFLLYPSLYNIFSFFLGIIFREWRVHISPQMQAFCPFSAFFLAPIIPYLPLISSFY